MRVVFRGQRADGDDRLLLRGHQRALKKLLQDAGIPPWERASYPLLEDELGIVAVPGVGYRDCDPAPAGEPALLWEVGWRAHVR